MDTTLLNFIAVLRKARLPVGSGEAETAALTLSLIGYDNRQHLKQALGMVLAKSQQDKLRFDELFEHYFSATSLGAASKNEEDEPGGLGDEVDALLKASDDELALAVQKAGQQVGVEDIRLSTQRGVYVRRILEELDWPVIQDAIIRGGEALAGGQQRLNTLRGFSARLRATAKAHVDRQYALHAQPNSEQLREQVLLSTQIRQLDTQQIQQCRALVNKIIRRLVKRFKRRKRYDRRGVLDIRRTLRHNMATDGLLFQPQWRQTHKDRPQVFVVCDVSGSVQQYAELMMLFMYCMQEVLPKVRCYAFSNRLEDVSSIFAARDPEPAIREALRSIGGGATDYGTALWGFKNDVAHLLNRNSVLIVLGDARNNKANPRLDLFSEFTKAAGKTWWLNPENRLLWNSGDSVLDAYGEFCDGIFEVGTLEQLEQFCEYLLRHTL